MNTVLKILRSIIFIAAIITIAGLTNGSPVKHEKSTADCVKISKWVNCSNICSDAKCLKFKNDCAKNVKITYKIKNPDASWSYQVLILKGGAESEEEIICPYIEFKWSYIEM
jgi:hypothetical protein